MAEEHWHYTHLYDGGDKGCGELLLELRLYFRPLAPGSLVCILTRDPGAPTEMPAWCRLTGRTLVRAAHPRYLVEKTPSPKG